jgi:hypothetical protein
MNTRQSLEFGGSLSSPCRHQGHLIVCSTQKEDQRKIASLFFPFTSSPSHLGSLDALRGVPVQHASDDGLHQSTPRPKSLQIYEDFL